MTARTDDELWSAIADPSRRRVLDLLVSNGEVSASWLAGRCRSPARPSPSIWPCSKRAGLVSRRKQGREVLYQVEAGRLDQATRAMARARRAVGPASRRDQAARRRPRTRKNKRGAVMTEELTNLRAAPAPRAVGLPTAVDRARFQAELDDLRVREKAHTREGDAIAAARRRLPMVEVDAGLTLPGPAGRSPCSTRSKGADSSSPTTSCGTTVSPRPSSAKGAPGSPARSPSCPTCTPATSPTRSSARGPTTRAAATASSWTGTCPGTRRRTLSSAAGRAPERPVPPRVLPARRRPCLRDLLDHAPRRRSDRQQLRAHGPHGVRTPGAVGGLAPGLAPAVLHHAHRRRRSRVAARARWPAGRPIAQWPRLQAGRPDDLGTGHDGR